MLLGRAKSSRASAHSPFYRGFRLIALAPVLALMALSAWAFASPMGASPDDNFHLVSTWCSTGDDAYCQPGTDEKSRLVPGAILWSSCYAMDSDQSAACESRLDFETDALVEATRGNFSGEYPPLYYSAMSVFVGDNILFSVMTMRLFNVLLFVGITTALYLLLPVRRRPTLIWGWLLTTMPLGLFLIASNNPSGWAIAGVGTAWLALLGYYETMTRGKSIALGGLFVLAVLMAAGSRGDSAVYVAGSIGIVGILSFERTQRFVIRSVLPGAMLVVSVSFFLLSRQVSSGISGFGGGTESAEVLGGFGLLAYNVLTVPLLWTGVFGGFPLGWLDTTMPSVVMFFAIAAFLGVGFHGLSSLNFRKAFVIGSVGFVLWALPTYVLTAGGDKVGQQVQPRYILPLIVLLGGLLVLEVGRKRFVLGRVQSLAVVVALSGANLVALHTNIRRYVTGADVPSWNLDAGAEWFWSGAPSPMVVWTVGSLAFAGLVAILVREMSISAARVPEIAADDTAMLPAR
jgi:hypothetical protein